jgi:ATP-dependent Clp protease protease subunit
MRDALNEILAKHTGQDLERVQKDTDRDFFMSGNDAREYGLIDHVMASRDDLDHLEEKKE